MQADTEWSRKLYDASQYNACFCTLGAAVHNVVNDLLLLSSVILRRSIYNRYTNITAMAYILLLVKLHLAWAFPLACDELQASPNV